MTSTDFYTNNSFSVWAERHLVIDEDASGLVCHCPDQSGRWFAVHCSEEGTVPNPVSCSCGASNCKHQAVVAAMYNRIYKVAPKVEAPVETPVVKKARKPRTGLVRKVRGGGLVKVEQKPVAKIIELPVQTTKITDISTRGNFGTKAFSLMR